MKKLSLVAMVLGLGLAYGATDFSQMTTEELLELRGKVAVEDREAFRDELQSRLSQLSPEEKEKLGLAQGYNKSSKIKSQKEYKNQHRNKYQHQTNAEFFEKAGFGNGHGGGGHGGGHGGGGNGGGNGGGQGGGNGGGNGGGGNGSGNGGGGHH